MNIPNVQLPNVDNLIHAYRVAPWRLHRQWLGSALLAVVALAMVAALYLDVTSQTAVTGREIQELNSMIITSQQVSGDLQTELAYLTSASAMEERAVELGFRSVQPEEVEYLVVPGYAAPAPVSFANETAPQLTTLAIMPEYNQSLLDWFDEQLINSRGLQ